jgi:hypothetical protein
LIRGRHLLLGVAIAGVACIALIPSAAAKVAKPAPTPVGQLSVVVSGLNSPKHLAFGPDGHLYVAESGVGDPTSAPANCVMIPGDAGPALVNACVGKTGAIARIDGNQATTVLGGLESVQEPGEATGPSAVAFDHGRLAVLMQDLDVRADGSTGLPGGDEFGKGLLAEPGSSTSSWVLFPNFAAYATENPQVNGGGTQGETANDSDPYDITAYRGGWAVVDAAANDLLWISPLGRISMLARFPTQTETAPPGVFGPVAVTVQAQAVPTSVAVGPDGALYVGGLRGAPSLPGTADVYRVVPGSAPTVYATGFSAVTDIAFDRSGNLLVLEYNVGGLLSPPSAGGALISVSRFTHQQSTVISSGLTSPTGLAVGADGAIYISNNGTSAGTDTPSGQILRFK